MTVHLAASRRRMMRLGALLVAALSAWAGCGERPAAPPPVQNAAQAEPRLVVLSPAIAIMAVDIGLEDRIVGKHAYDLVLADTVPVVGDQAGIDHEALVRLRPTHVITQWGHRALPASLERLASREGFEVVNYELLTLDDIARTVDDLYIDFVRAPAPERPIAEVESGELRFHDPSAAIGRALPSARLARAWRPREADLSKAGRVLLLGAVDPAAVVGPGSFHHQALERIGGRPAVDAGSPWMELDAEDVLRLMPDAIVLIAPRPVGTAPRALDEAAVRARLGVLSELAVPAVESGRLAVIDHPLALTPSTAMADVADELAALLAGWAEEAGGGS